MPIAMKEGKNIKCNEMNAYIFYLCKEIKQIFEAKAINSKL